MPFSACSRRRREPQSRVSRASSSTNGALCVRYIALMSAHAVRIRSHNRYHSRSTPSRESCTAHARVIHVDKTLCAFSRSIGVRRRQRRWRRCRARAIARRAQSTYVCTRSAWVEDMEVDIASAMVVRKSAEMRVFRLKTPESVALVRRRDE